MEEVDAAYLLHRCTEILNSGGLIVLPTDTVYGLAVRADVARAVEEAFYAKGREEEKALVVMLPGAREAEALAIPEQRETVRRLSYFWPGPLTVVVGVVDVPWKRYVAPASESLGIRVPDDHFLLELLAVCWPLAVTSANPAGGRAPSAFSEIDAGLLAAADLALDGGPRGSGRPSTVAEIRGGDVRLLRRGEIRERELRHALARCAP